MKKIGLFIIAICFVFASFSPAQAVMQTLSPYNGNYMAYVGTLEDGLSEPLGNDVYDNYISQTVTDASTISLYYNFFTWDYEYYDEPGFVIDIDGTEVLSYDAADIDYTEVWLDSTGWTYFSYAVDPQESHTLTIYAGNTGDESVQSFVFIDLVLNGFVNGGFETGDLTGWTSAGDAGVLGSFDYDPEGDYGAVPIPAAVWLLGSGLLGLVGLRKKFSA